jgi:hypothetical protein
MWRKSRLSNISPNENPNRILRKVPRNTPLVLYGQAFVSWSASLPVVHLDYVSDLRVFRILVCLSTSAESGMAGEGELRLRPCRSYGRR